MNSNIINSTLILLTISAGIMLTSCSKDDDSIEPVAIETMETDQDQPILVDNIRIDFKILNTDSVAMKTFKEGENFYFTLSLTNVGTETLYLPYEQEIIGDEAFKVYTADGNILIQQGLSGLPGSLTLHGTRRPCGLLVTSFTSCQTTCPFPKAVTIQNLRSPSIITKR